MKKLILALIIMCLLAGCKKEEIVDNNITQKIYAKVIAYSSDGTSFESEIEIAQ